MDLTSLRNKDNQLWLNVASSTYVLKDFVNLDNHIVLALSPIYPLLRPFLSKPKQSWFAEFKRAKASATLLKHDCRRRLPLPADCADHIVCSHFLEHLYPLEATKVLRDFRRVLKKGGTLHIVVPNLNAMIKTYMSSADSDSEAADKLIDATILSNERRPSLAFRVLEFLGYEGMKHRWMYNYGSLASRIESAGFSLKETNDTPSAALRRGDGDGSLHVVARKI